MGRNGRSGRVAFQLFQDVAHLCVCLAEDCRAGAGDGRGVAGSHGKRTRYTCTQKKVFVNFCQILKTLN